MPNVTVYLGLGSNLGDREGHLGRGLEALGARGVRVTAVSGLYETEPVGGPAQGPYLNLAAGAETALSPEALLEAALEAEAEAGRVRTVRNAPRTLDVDILFYGDLVRRTGHLTVPHPRLHERRFVLVPLAVAQVGAEAEIDGDSGHRRASLPSVASRPGPRTLDAPLRRHRQ